MTEPLSSSGVASGLFGRPSALLLLVLAAAVLPWLPLLDAPFLVDERVLHYEARKWIGLDAAAPWTNALGGSSTWRPLLVYVYWLDSGAPSWLAHGINLALHAGFVGLAWLWLQGRLATGAATATGTETATTTVTTTAAATFGALFLGLHPAHVATAGWVGGRADGLMALCAVAALLAWDRGRWLLCALLLVCAVLFKETGVGAVGMLLLVVLSDPATSRAPTDGRRPARRAAAAVPAVVGALVAFGLSVQRSDVAPAYLPTYDGVFAALAAAPLFALELVAPAFHPLGVPARAWDLVGCIVALGVVSGFVTLLRRSPARRLGLLGLGMAAAALLPVLHVLPNDGGQWYLLLPSLGAALAWAGAVQGVVATGPVGVEQGSAKAGTPARILLASFLVLLALVAVRESLAWRAASFDVDSAIEARRVQVALEGIDAVTPPGVLPVGERPHRGPTFCCGLPYQLYEPLAPR